MKPGRSRIQQQAQQVGRQSGVLRFGHDALRMNDHVPSRWYLQTMTTNGLPQTAPNTISQNRTAESFLDAEAEAAEGQKIGAKENSEVRTGTPAAGAIDGVEVSAAHQTRIARKTQAMIFIRA
jgi:hypothetical protein